MDWNILNTKIINCSSCPRLVNWREEVAQKKRRAYETWDYWGKPVPGFGDHQAKILILGLAPGAHGSNRTGRMFTGDASGDFLYPTLYKVGFANQPHAVGRDDGLKLKQVFISAVCRCVPPGNKPMKEEMNNCQYYLEQEIFLLKNLQGLVVLGHIAFHSAIHLMHKIFPANNIKPPVFHHGQKYNLNTCPYWFLASYHPSQQNTQTGRLTELMFTEVWQKALRFIDK